MKPVDLLQILKYMDGYNSICYFNTETRCFVHDCDLSEASGENSTLPVPQFNDVFLRDQFLKKMSVDEETLRKYSLTVEMPFVDVFAPLTLTEHWLEYLRNAHFLSEDIGIESEYYEFYALETIEAAKKWCVLHGIRFDDSKVDDWG